MKTSIHVEGELLKAELAGTFALADAMDSFRQVVESIAVHHPRIVLMDARDVAGHIKPLERFCYGEFVAKETSSLPGRGVFPIPRFAYVLAPDVIDPQRMGETAAVNRGMLVKAFTDLQEALNWLGSSTPSR